MLVKGIIDQKVDNYTYKVRIPFLNKIESDSNPTLSEELSEAPMCTISGVHTVYRSGDVVYIDFENDDFSDPVILGRLDRVADIGSYTNVDTSTLNVDITANLPEQTSIGEVKPSEISALIGVRGNIQEQLNVVSENNSVFVAVYGETTQAQVASAISDGKAIVATNSIGMTLPYSANTGSVYVFSGMVGDTRYSFELNNSNVWKVTSNKFFYEFNNLSGSTSSCYAIFAKVPKNETTYNGTFQLLVSTVSNVTQSNHGLYLLTVYNRSSGTPLVHTFSANVLVIKRGYGANINFGYYYSESDNSYYIGVYRSSNYTAFPNVFIIKKPDTSYDPEISHYSDNNTEPSGWTEITNVNTLAIAEEYVAKSGDTMTGQLKATAAIDSSSGGSISVAHGTSGRSASVVTERTDTGTKVWLGVGSAGVNHGVYSSTLGKWLVYGDATNVYLNGNASTATTLSSTLSVDKGGTGATVAKTALTNLGISSRLRAVTFSGEYGRRRVVALAPHMTAATQTGGSVQGLVFFQRQNLVGAQATYWAVITVGDIYNADGEPGIKWNNFGNIPYNTSSAVGTGTGIRPCKFKYNDTWYVGFEYYTSSAEKQINWLGFHQANPSMDPICVEYVSSDGSTTVYNQEILSSINFTATVQDANSYPVRLATQVLSSNRSTSINAADTNYDTIMSRGIKLVDTDPGTGADLVSGAVCLVYTP